MLLVRRNEVYFAWTLAVFAATDIGAWVYLRYSFLPPIIEATKERYEQDGDHFGAVKLKFIEIQVLGDWKWYRHIFLTAVVFSMIVSATFPVFKQVVAAGVQKLLSLLSFQVDLSQLTLLVPDLLLFLFIAALEVWIWLFRLRSYWTVRVVSDLENDYTIAPKTISRT